MFSLVSEAKTEATFECQSLCGDTKRNDTCSLHKANTMYILLCDVFIVQSTEMAQLVDDAYSADYEVQTTDYMMPKRAAEKTKNKMDEEKRKKREKSKKKQWAWLGQTEDQQGSRWSVCVEGSSGGERQSKNMRHETGILCRRRDCVFTSYIALSHVRKRDTTRYVNNMDVNNMDGT